MATRILLIRHAETVDTVEDRFSGAKDVPLSEIGQMHAALLAQRLSGLKVQAVYSSPMQRAMETAQLIAEPHGCKVISVDALREINHGHWEGLTRAEVEERFPEEYAEYVRDPLHFQPEGGTSAQSVVERAAPALLEIVRAHPDQEVAVVSHKATNRLLIGYLIGIDLRGYRDKIAQRPTCLNVLDFADEHNAKLFVLNDISHYEICGRPDPEYVV